MCLPERVVIGVCVAAVVAVARLVDGGEVSGVVGW